MPYTTVVQEGDYCIGCDHWTPIAELTYIADNVYLCKPCAGEQIKVVGKSIDIPRPLIGTRAIDKEQS